MRRWSLTIAITSVVLGGFFLLSRNFAGRQLNALLHGNGNFHIRKLQFEIWNAGRPQFLEVMDKNTLDLFSADLRHALRVQQTPVS
jgi:hypothetical protein